MHLLVSRYANRTDFSTWFDACPLTIACANGSAEMIELLLEVGFHNNYDLNRALLTAVQKTTNISESEIKHHIINLLIESGANPHAPINKHLEAQTPLAVAAFNSDVDGVKTMLSSYSIILPSQRSARRCDPLLASQPETYFQTLEAREDDVIDASIQVS
jgi:ankyrin repeat protein